MAKKKTSTVAQGTHFENQVADLFRKFGYKVETNTEVRSAQTDIMALAAHGTMPNLIIECKHHASTDIRVGIDETENFVSRVIRLRNEGVVDKGYLVTNTGFTSAARGNVEGSISRFVYLVTFHELHSRLINADLYLEAKINEFSGLDNPENYVELRVLDTTGLDCTLFDAAVGPVVLPSREYPLNRAPRIRTWAVPLAEAEELVKQGCAKFDAKNSSYLLELMPLKQRVGRFAAHAKAVLDLGEARADGALAEISLRAEEAKKAYARELLDKLRVEATPEIVQLVAEHPPTFTPSLLERLGLESAPFYAERLWRRHSMSFASRGGPALMPTKPDVPAVTITENSQGLAEEKDAQLQLIPMSPVTQSLRTFISSPTETLYVLLGDYGAGKTTAIRRFFLQLAREKQVARNGLALNPRTVSQG